MAGSPMRIEVKWNVAELVRALNRSQEGVRGRATALMHEIGKSAVSDMQSRLKSQGKVDTGNLVNAIQYRIEDRRGRQTLYVGPRAKDANVEPYDAVIEFGRTPGSRMPPDGALLPWMSRHGIPAEKEYIIRRGIGLHGLRGQPFPYVEPAAQSLEAAFGNGVEALIDSLVSDIK